MARAIRFSSSPWAAIEALSSVKAEASAGVLRTLPGESSSWDSGMSRISRSDMSVYLDKNSGDKVDRTEWHRIVTFQDGLVEMLEKHAKRGRLVYVSGKLQTRKWRKDGEDSDRFSTEILLVPGGRIQFLDVRHEAA